jgi:hypothetical protein
MSAYNSLGPIGGLRVSGLSEVVELYLLFIIIVITTILVGFLTLDFDMGKR